MRDRIRARRTVKRGDRCSALLSGKTLPSAAWSAVWLGFLLSIAAVMFDDLGNVIALLQATVTLIVAAVEHRCR